MKTNKEIKMQELFKSYITNDIRSDDRLYFEENIKDFPDLFEEYKQINLFFTNTEKADMNNYMKRKTINISVDVMDKLNNRPASKSSFISNIKYASISAMSVILIVIASNFNYFGSENSNFLGIDEDTELLSELIDVYEENYDTESDDFFDMDDISLYDEDNDSSIEIDKEEAYELIKNGSVNFELDNIPLDNMNENEINQLFEDIENAKII